MSSIPSPRNAPRWFDPRARQIGSWAFILNRLSTLGLTIYLGLHLAVLNKLTQGTQAYNDFVASAQSPIIKVGEVILIAAVAFHGFNGLRLILHSFGIGIRQQRNLSIGVTAAAILVTIFFTIHLFGV
jgi:succinate dehydrogenase / fumarate reductase cytochrome b subunit